MQITPSQIANDPTVPDAVRRAFAKVTHQVVRIYDDGSTGVINVTGAAQAVSLRAKSAEAIGRRRRDGAELVDVAVVLAA